MTNSRPARRKSIRRSITMLTTRATNSGVTTSRPSRSSGGAASETSRPSAEITLRSGVSTAERVPALTVVVPVIRSPRRVSPSASATSSSDR